MKRLIVIATGLDGSPKKWQPLLDRLHQEESLIGSDILLFTHCGFWNFQAFRKGLKESIETLSITLKAKIEQKYLDANSRGAPYDDIIFMGHSFSGLIVRHTYLLADGGYEGIPKNSLSWTEKVSRFVLIASTNRGFEPNHFLFSALASISSTTGLLPLLKDTVQGAPFITNLRISWIRHFSNPKNKALVVVQLLGDQDSVVRREDSIDLQQFPNGEQFDIPEASHDDLYRPQGSSPKARAEWDLRYNLIKWTILEYNPAIPNSN